LRTGFLKSCIGFYKSYIFDHRFFIKSYYITKMSGPQLASLSSSALSNTINASESRRIPAIYNTPPVNATHATTYNRADYSSGTVANNKSVSFSLNKYGIINQILFNYSKTSTDTNGVVLANDIFKAIKKIELMSSSRVVSTLTSYDLMCQFSDLSYSEYLPVQEWGTKARAVAVSGADTNFCIPLVFPFMSNGTNANLNSTFLEPLSVKVTFDTITTGTNMGPVNDVYLTVRYAVYPEDVMSEILATNYDAPTLNQVLTRQYFDENPQTTTLAAGAVTTQLDGQMTVELKNTDCVGSFYVVVVRNDDNDPCEITNLKLSGSGNDILELNQQELHYSKLNPYGFSGGLPVGAVGSISNIAKVQMGVFDQSAIGSFMSLREINNPKLVVDFRSIKTGAQQQVLNLAKL
jgi:hypothetical protein